MFPRVVFCHMKPGVILKCQQNISYPVEKQKEPKHILRSTNSFRKLEKAILSEINLHYYNHDNTSQFLESQMCKKIACQIKNRKEEFSPI